MFIKNECGDVSDEEFEKIVAPFDSMFDSFVKEFILPEACAFYVAIGFREECLWQQDFDLFIGSVLDMLNHPKSYVNEIKPTVIKLLKLKYGLNVINEKPLELSNVYSREL